MEFDIADSGAGGNHEWDHVNRYEASGVLTTAWKQVFGNRLMRAGCDASHRELAILSTVSSAAGREQEKWLASMLDNLGVEGQPFALFRYCDTSPRRFAFGRLQDALQPLARYPFWDKDRKIWG